MSTSMYTASNASVEPALASGRVAVIVNCSPLRGWNTARRAPSLRPPVSLSGTPLNSACQILPTPTRQVSLHGIPSCAVNTSGEMRGRLDCQVTAS